MLRLQDLYLFKVYQTREAAIRDGLQLKPYDPKRPIKRWYDAARKRVYENALAVVDHPGEDPLLNENGKPYLDELILDKADVELNIPPDVSNFERLDAAEIQVPCRSLTADEYLDFVGFGGREAEPMVINRLTDIKLTDRELLEKILQGIEKLLLRK